MQINQPGAPLTLMPVAAAGLRHWQIGQLLDARVIGHPQPNFTRLRIDGTTFDARGTLLSAAGSQVRLRVALQDGAMVLKSANLPSTPEIAAPERALARVLPRQGSLVDTLTLLRTTHQMDRSLPPASNPASNLQTVQPHPSATALVAAAKQFLASLPSVASLEVPAALKQAVLANVLPLGTPAADGSPPLAAGQDHETRELLLKLRHEAALPAAHGFTRSPPAPGRARAMPSVVPLPPAATPEATAQASVTTSPAQSTVDAALARIATRHLSNVAAAAGGGVPFVIEIPVRFHDRIDMWRFEIDPDDASRGDADSARRARIHLRMQFDETTSINAEISSTGAHLSIRLGASVASLQARISHHLPQLATALERRGIEHAALTTGSVRATDAPPPARQMINETI